MKFYSLMEIAIFDLGKEMARSFVDPGRDQ